MSLQWNDLLDELNSYLANLYLFDITNRDKMRLVKKSEVLNPLLIDWQLRPLTLWFEIMDMAGKEKLIRLMETIVSKGEPGDGDEFLLGALQTLKEGHSIRNKALPDRDWMGGAFSMQTKEKILSKRSTLLPIGFLEAGTEAAKAVVRIECGDELGTGFIINDHWLLTNNHVIPSEEHATKASIQLGYQYPKGIKIDVKKVHKIIPEREINLEPTANQFFTNEEQDWTLVKIKERDISGYGYLRLCDTDIRKDEFVNIIQHPLGGPKQIGIYNNLVMYAGDTFVQYMTDTNDGSSGSPVFNSDWEVVAIHHSGGWMTEPLSNQQVKRNQGTRIRCIKDFMINKNLFVQ